MQRVTKMEATAPCIINPQQKVMAIKMVAEVAIALPINNQRRLSTKKFAILFIKKHLVLKIFSCYINRILIFLLKNIIG